MRSKYVVSKKQRRTNTSPSPRAAPKHSLPELVPNPPIANPLQTIALISSPSNRTILCFRLSDQISTYLCSGEFKESHAVPTVDNLWHFLNSKGTSD